MACSDESASTDSDRSPQEPCSDLEEGRDLDDASTDSHSPDVSYAIMDSESSDSDVDMGTSRCQSPELMDADSVNERSGKTAELEAMCLMTREG